MSISDTFSRRDMLQRTCTGFGMTALAGLLGQSAFAQSQIASPKSQIPLPLSHIAPRAKRCIFLFMNGGPSHLDTFDPKPALAKYAGQHPDTQKYRKAAKGAGYLPSPLKFEKCGKAGIDVSESFPHLKQVIDECCVIRSMKTDTPNHEPALLQMHTGNLQPIRPSIGSWLLYGVGSENENLPGYVVLRPSHKIVVGPALWSNSFLPAQYQATTVFTMDMAVEKLVANIKNPSLAREEQRQQLDLLGQLNKIHLTRRQNDAQLEAQIKTMETAFRMQQEAMTTFDISREPQSVRKMYGQSTFARSVLLARRLVEDGVRFVTVYYTDAGPSGTQPWDTHKKHDEGHRALCADADQPTAALIRDLKNRGMLDDTLVIWGGEFGRTPYAEDKVATPGRDHHNTAFSMLLAGGGVKGGTVYGSSDELGMNVADNLVHVHDLHATILHLMGLDHEKLTYRYAGRDFRLTDVHGHVVKEIIV
jgi:hypothetical protein